MRRSGNVGCAGVRLAKSGYPWVVIEPVRAVKCAVVVVPAHNEALLLQGCLRSVLTAAACVPVPIQIIVVLDACDDGSAAVVQEFCVDIDVITIDIRNVGAARAVGFAHARSIGNGGDSRTWYATTDADSRVGPDWLLRQIAANADTVLGVVHVPEWRHHPPVVALRYLRDYRSEGPRHNHVHGANLGFRANAYWRVGGFAALETGEDVELVERFERYGYVVSRDPTLSVATSDRQIARAPAGFAHHLRELSLSRPLPEVGERL
jgi:glycosyltransferase involved in cell wall biosynthesis